MGEKIANIRKDQQYFMHLASGKQLLAAKPPQYKEAREALLAGQEGQGHPEVLELLNEVEYQYHLAAAKKLREDGQMRDAWARFRIAAGYATSDKEKLEVAGYIKEVEPLIPPPPKENAG